MPLAMVATEVSSGRPVVFHAQGDVILPLRASCAYPGVFRPVSYGDEYLVDGGVSMRVPARALRQMGATRVISSALRRESRSNFSPRNLFQVAIQCLEIMQTPADLNWRKHSSVVIEPDVYGLPWNRFDSTMRLIERGERATRAALPCILSRLEHTPGRLGVSQLLAERVA